MPGHSPGAPGGERPPRDIRIPEMALAVPREEVARYTTLDTISMTDRAFRGGIHCPGGGDPPEKGQGVDFHFKMRK
jgi:hypothetical protein